MLMVSLTLIKCPLLLQYILQCTLCCIKVTFQLDITSTQMLKYIGFLGLLY